MAVLTYQVTIFLIILIARAVSKRARNVAVLCCVIFTLSMVYTNSLMVVQFITIILAFIVSSSINKNSREKQVKTKTFTPKFKEPSFKKYKNEKPKTEKEHSKTKINPEDYKETTLRINAYLIAKQRGLITEIDYKLPKSNYEIAEDKNIVDKIIEELKNNNFKNS